MKFKNPLSVILLILLAACSTDKAGREGTTKLTSNEDSTFCSVPNISHFAAHQNDNEQASAIEAALETSRLSNDGQSLVGTSSAQFLKKWILFAITPLSMSCKNYQSGGAQKYSAKAYANFVAVAVDSLRPEAQGGLRPTEVSLMLNDNVNEVQKKFISVLLTLNRRIREDKSANFRTRGQDVIHGVPLTPQEEVTVNEIAKEGLLKVVTYDRPFKNASGEMVSGRFIHYPPGQDVLKQITSLAKVYEKAQQKDNQEYQKDAARIMRHCITIHPFLDANGRSCTLLAVWMQAQRNLSHSVLWSGEDILLKESEFILRYEKGIKFHEDLKKSLK